MNRFEHEHRDPGEKKRILSGAFSHLATIIPVNMPAKPDLKLVPDLPLDPPYDWKRDEVFDFEVENAAVESPQVATYEIDHISLAQFAEALARRENRANTPSS